MREVWYPKNREKHRKYVSNNNKRLKAEMIELINKLKDVPCADCGHTFPPCVMDFDHVRGTKKFGIALAKTQRVSKQKILNEIQKCDIVCANCHRIRTHITRKNRCDSYA